MIPFNVPLVTGTELEYIAQVIEAKKLSGDGSFTKRCHKWFEDTLKISKSLLTTSGTHALEMAALLADLQSGDEVIMPSFTFTSTANAFVLRGCSVVFVDIRPDTMNLDETLLAEAISQKTKAIVPVHYAGVACEMDTIMKLAQQYGLKVIEDAAQGLMASYKGRPLGGIGDYGAISFHETKNFTCGEGGAIFLNDLATVQKAEIVREKGTNRSRFLRGEIDKYTWVYQGSSYLPSELNAAYLFAQLEKAETIIADRLKAWFRYYKRLEDMAIHAIDLPSIPDSCQINGHIFYIKATDINERDSLISWLKKQGIQAVYHYIPLHSAPYGLENTITRGSVHQTIIQSERLIRLPIFYGITDDQIDYICDSIEEYFKLRS